VQAVRYEARRSLVSGHTEAGLYTINLQLTDCDRKRDVERKQQRALGGATYTVYHRGDVVWQCETAPLQGSDADLMREFLDSVEDGQVFQFDPLNWAGVSPNAMRSVVITSDGYTENRYAQRGSQSLDWFKFRFSFTEQP
jgi:hypothetical protein